MSKVIYSTIFLLYCFPSLLFAQKNERPNIIFILTDDQRWDALGHADNEIISTPHMDQLAQSGIYFKNAFVTTPICAASRASIMTGLYERTHDFTFGTPPLKKEYVDISYPKLLKEAGYQLGFFGKFGMQFQERMDTALFDARYITGTNGYFRLEGEGWGQHIHLTDYTMNKAMDFIENRDQKQPFCVSISFNAPHADDASPQQYFWPARKDSLYGNVNLAAPPLSDGKSLNALPDFLQDSLYMGRIRWRWRYETETKRQQMVKAYYRMISTIDDNIGRLRQLLKEQQLDKNTVIILMGDNGYFLGERGLAGKWLMYENSIRVPLILFDPQLEQSKTVEQMALNIDISPTILAYANIDIPESVQGRNLKAFVEGKAENWRDFFVCEHLYDMPYIPKSEGLRTENWKYFRYLDHPETEELYDLKNDPLETQNLIQDPLHQSKVKEFRKKLDAELAKMEAASVDRK